MTNHQDYQKLSTKHLLKLTSVILAGDSVYNVMEVLHYIKTVHIHKHIYESLIKLARRGFADWIDNSSTQEKTFKASIGTFLRFV